jgi:hypothetical protein
MMESRSSFGMYEILRIVVPGFYVMVLLLLFLDVFFPNISAWAHEALGSTVLVLGGSLVAGVSLYVKETPKRRRAFIDNQPSTYLLNRARLLGDIPPLNDEEAQRMYFYILNHHMPSSFHEKIFFFGTVYTVMINIRRVSFWFGLASLVGLGVMVAHGESIVDYPEAGLFAVLTWLIYGINVRYNKADRKLQDNYQDQIFWLQMHDDLLKELLSKRTLPKKD